MEEFLSAHSPVHARLQLDGEDFSYVPRDGDFGVNRSCPGYFALGDLSLRVRPASFPRQTLPPLPDLDNFPVWTTLSSRTGDPGNSLPLCQPIFLAPSKVLQLA